MKQSRDPCEDDGMHDIGSHKYLWRKTVEQQQQHHDDAARSYRGHAYQATSDQPDERHAQKSLGGRRAMRHSLFDSLLQQQQSRNYDQQNTYRGFDKAVDSVAVEVTNVHQQPHSSDRAWNAPHRKRDHDLEPHRVFLEV